MMNMKISLMGLIAMACAAGPAVAGEPLLHYPLNEGSGRIANDVSNAQWNLQIGTGMGWSTPGIGLGSGNALSIVRESDVYAKNTDADVPVPMRLLSYTWSGWYQLSEVNTNAGVLIDMPATEGNGLQIHFSSKADQGTGALLQALVLMTTPPGANPHTGRGVWYSTWNVPYGTIGEWIFFAITVDTLSDREQIRFYVGTETQPAKPLGGRMTVSDPHSCVTGAISEIWLANNGASSMPRPLGLGTFLNDFRFFGSDKDSSGALSQDELESIRVRALQ